MRHVIGLMIMLAISGCSSEKKGSAKDQFPIPAGVNYFVIDEATNPTLKKTNLKIRLNQRVSEEVLKNIAGQLKSDRQQYERVWIYYYLEGASTTSMPWATSHFSPELKVEIDGSTPEQAAKQATVQGSADDGKQLGKWLDDTAVQGSTVLLFEKNGKYSLRTVYKDGSSYDRVMTKKGKNRFNDSESGHGEYYVIEATGDLGMYNKENKRFALALKAP